MKQSKNTVKSFKVSPAWPALGRGCVISFSQPFPGGQGQNVSL